MRQGEVASQGKWAGSASGGVKAPEALSLPDPARRFTDTARRLGALADGHPMEEWLRFMMALAQAQHVAATTPAPLAALEYSRVEQAVEARLPPLAAHGYRPEAAWRDGLSRLLDGLDSYPLPTQAFTRMAASLPASSLRLLPDRGMCPCCGSTPVAGLVTASGRTPGARYLYCSLCSTAWNHVRAVCITCGGSRALSLKAIDEDSGTARAETCGDCRTYSKVLYQAKDMTVDPFADDLATLGLDLLVAEAGWSRHAPNPLVLVGKS